MQKVLPIPNVNSASHAKWHLKTDITNVCNQPQSHHRVARNYPADETTTWFFHTINEVIIFYKPGISLLFISVSSPSFLGIWPLNNSARFSIVLETIKTKHNINHHSTFGQNSTDTHPVSQKYTAHKYTAHKTRMLSIWLKEYYEIVNEARPLSGFFSHGCWFFYRNAFLIMKPSKLPSFRAIRALSASQSTFEK